IFEAGRSEEKRSRRLRKVNSRQRQVLHKKLRTDVDEPMNPLQLGPIRLQGGDHLVLEIVGRLSQQSLIQVVLVLEELVKSAHGELRSRRNLGHRSPVITFFRE